MAVADVYLPEMAGEDHLIAFPRAPPPSPEMQPRNHSRVFDIPASKFEEIGRGGEGMGLDLRRNTFPFEEEAENDIPHLGAVLGYGCGSKRSDSAVHFKDCNDDDGNALLDAGSPQKRVCCSPSTLPANMMTTAFPSSNHDSLVSSGFGSFQPLGNSVSGAGDDSTGFLNCSATGSHSGSNSPSYFSSIRSLQTSPHLIAQTQESSTHTLRPPTDPSSACLSRSYDLHTIHPHLPHSFEATQLPQVRTSRSRTLDSASQEAHARMLDSHYGARGEGEDPTQRRRKVSIKRKNPDEDESDPNLQFSFEYSYSSTGSSGESDWVMVDRKMEPGWPLGKKACCASDPIRREFAVGGVALQGMSSLPSFSSGHGGRGGGGLFESPHSNPQDMSGATGAAIFPPQFANSAPDVGVSIDRVETPTNQNANLHSLESESMMECEARLDSLDGMDCDQLTSDPPYPVFGGVVEMSHYQQSAMAMESDGLVMRTHPRDVALPTPSLSLRRSCVEEYLQPGVSSGCGDGLVAELDKRLNLSKSL